MDSTIVVAILSLCGTLVGSLAGILAANKLTIYRIEQLEKKVEKHNSVIERTFKLETEYEQLEKEVHQLEDRVNH